MTHESAETIAADTARILLRIQAVLFNAETPFTFTSGRKSPVYVDCRRIISFPEARATLMDYAVQTLERELGPGAFDAIAGGETAGIPFAAWIAERLGLPMQYVRKQPKGFGRNAQIEGVLPEGARTLLVEDLASEGGSKERFVAALRQAGATVESVFVVFHYGIFPQSLATMAQLGVRLFALATWWDVLAAASADRAFDAATLDAVEAFLHDPTGWAPAS